MDLVSKMKLMTTALWSKSLRLKTTSATPASKKSKSKGRHTVDFSKHQDNKLHWAGNKLGRWDKVDLLELRMALDGRKDNK